MTMPRVGLLPLYLELYDQCKPDARGQIEGFLAEIAEAIRGRGVEVSTASVCRVKSEFVDAIRSFEAEDLDAIVTLHLAYSPSLESSEILSKTELPIMVLDTTPDFSFGPKDDPKALMYNHGIHGVQDMCNLLIRKGKSFEIEVGHWQESDVLDRIVSWARAATMRKALRSSRIGRIGDAFAGMGDFAVPENVLKGSGVETVAASPGDIASRLSAVTDKRVEEEIIVLREMCAGEGVSDDTLRDSVSASLATRDWIVENGLTGFSMNFMETASPGGLPVVPFLETSLAMSRGLGYAGEGDVLTAALCGALLSQFPDTTFSEMFCPDWKGNAIFLSHMGEVNSATLAGHPRLIKKPFPYTDAADPVAIVGRLKAGKAVWVNLAPLEDGFRLLAAPVDVLDREESEAFGDMVHGWMRPEGSIADFLKHYSRLGGTHHAVLVYDAQSDMVEKFGRLMGWQVAGAEEWKG